MTCHLPRMAPLSSKVSSLVIHTTVGSRPSETTAHFSICLFLSTEHVRFHYGGSTRVLMSHHLSVAVSCSAHNHARSFSRQQEQFAPVGGSRHVHRSWDLQLFRNRRSWGGESIQQHSNLQFYDVVSQQPGYILLWSWGGRRWSFLANHIGCKCTFWPAPR